VIALLFAALLTGQNTDLTAIRAAGNSQLSHWLGLLHDGKIDEAVAMVVGDAHYRELGNDIDRTLPPKTFLNWIGTCTPSSFFNVEAPNLADGTVGAMYGMTCPVRDTGKRVKPGATINIVFVFSTKGDGIRI
jgi:hypothetical protein